MDYTAERTLWKIEDEVIERLGSEAWTTILHENTYNRPGETIELYRDDAGVAQYRFRTLTTTERQEQIEGRIEDQL